MSSAWLLPEHLADLLPDQARHVEELRRKLLDVARSYGCELVMPPLVEHLESLLSGTGQALDLQTFKLVDQLSGRTLGVRADATAQVARIDAHLLNREGVTRLCYCGPVLHTRPAGLQSSREPLQMGAEVYGHAGLEADLEVQDLALDCLAKAGVQGALLDLADARIVRGVLGDLQINNDARVQLSAALSAKDAVALADVARDWPKAVSTALMALTGLYGDETVLAQARQVLPANPLINAALNDLAQLGQHARQTHPDWRLGFDLADVGGYGYYSGARFAVYAPGSSDALARGGRYDEVGAIFGRNRPAVGFSLDLKELAERVPRQAQHAAIRAPWGEDAALRAAVRQAREQGETVVCQLPGHEHELQEFNCDRELVLLNGQWVVCRLE
jgi:ATP phosphoribosyltransferase regulatory subunit